MKLFNKTLSKREIFLYCFYIFSFVGIFIFLLWKCKFGFGNRDEAFYLTIPYRMLQGDGLFINEWHLSQMSGILLYPFVAIYMLIAKTTTGMILAFRYIYTVVQGIVAIVIFLRLKKTSLFGAVMTSIVFLIYAPFGIMAMSYNSLGIICLTLACVFLYTSNGKLVTNIFVGIFLAMAILCCPYLAILYVIYTLMAVIRWLITKNNKDTKFSFSNWLGITIGAFIVLVIFLIFVFSHTTIENFIKTIPYILNDPEHQSYPLSYIIKTYFRNVAHLTSITNYCYAALLLLVLIAIIDKKRKKHELIYLSLGAIATIVFLYEVSFTKPYINFVMFPINLYALIPFVILHKDKRMKQLFYFIYIPGVIYSFCLHLTSNQMQYAITSASAVTMTASIMMIAIKAYDSLKDANTKKLSTITVIVLCVTLMCQISAELYQRYESVFWDSSVSELTEKFDRSIEQGLYTTEYAKSSFENNLENLLQVKSEHGDKKNLLVFSKDTYDYLICSEFRNASYSAWLSDVSDSTINKLKSYYELNQDKIPDLIYICEENAIYTEPLMEISGLQNYEILSDNSILLY